ncbi:MAG: hypothetical protein L0H11_10340, partial [Brevibacterium aurantiacum]|nr:hypothetical protein [Brevibacterium aurantiacum]
LALALALALALKQHQPRNLRRQQTPRSTPIQKLGLLQRLSPILRLGPTPTPEQPKIPTLPKQ